jgi:nucleotide-binding universal stress UspA family protein
MRRLACRESELTRRSNPYFSRTGCGPAPDNVQLEMTTKLFDSVIIGFDGSEQAKDALALGRLLGSLGPSGIVLAYITDHQPPFERQRRVYAQARREKVHEVLAPAVSALADHGRVEPASIDSSSAARGLSDLASEYGAFGSCLLVIGSTHRGPVGRVLVGSVGELLISGAPCPITVAPRGFAQHAPASIAKVVVGFDGSPESVAALRTAHGLARVAGGKLHAVAVVHDSAHGRHDREAPVRNRMALVARLNDALGGLGETVEGTILEGNPAEQIADVARDADMLVLGARGYGPRHHVLVGSVSSKLIRSAPSPVLVLPRPAPDEDGESEGEAATSTRPA